MPSSPSLGSAEVRFYCTAERKERSTKMNKFAGKTASNSHSQPGTWARFVVGRVFWSKKQTGDLQSHAEPLYWSGRCNQVAICVTGKRAAAAALRSQHNVVLVQQWVNSDFIKPEHASALKRLSKWDETLSLSVLACCISQWQGPSRENHLAWILGRRSHSGSSANTKSPSKKYLLWNLFVLSSVLGDA